MRDQWGKSPEKKELEKELAKLEKTLDRIHAVEMVLLISATIILLLYLLGYIR